MTNPTILADTGTVHHDRVPNPKNPSRTIARDRVVFASVDEQLEAIKGEPIGSARQHGNGWNSWEGSTTYEEGYAYARDGFDEIRPMVDEIINRIVDKVADRTSPVFDMRADVTGAFVNVAAYLEGVPECMVEVFPTPERKGGKVVRLHYNTSALGVAYAECMIARGAAVLALIDVLGRLGANVEVWVECSGIHNGRLATILTRVKEAHDTVDVNRMMAVIGSPAWHRRISWQTRAVFGLAGCLSGGSVASCPISCADDVNADVVVARDHSSGDPIVADPDGWVLSTLRELGFDVAD